MKSFRSLAQRWAVSILLLGLALPICAQTVRHDWGPFHASYTDYLDNDRVKTLGPLYESADDAPDKLHLTMLRPFYSEARSDEDARTLREVLWPIGSTRRVDDSFYWRVLLGMGWNDDLTDPTSRYRTWILPFYFQGKAKTGEDYFALFPFFGTIREFLGRDLIRFVLFPLYGHSEINEVKTTSVLWPIFSRSQGHGIERKRVFPFYGTAKHRDVFEKRFILWPFWNSVKYNYKKSKGSGWILFPITGRLSLGDQESYWFLPPFFRYAKGNGNTRWIGPWPFIQKSTGAINKFYFFPLFGTKTIEHVTRSFLIWPIGWHSKKEYHDSVKNRYLLLPFWRYSKTEAKLDEHEEPIREGLEETRWKLWPLMSYNAKGHEKRFRMLELWPAGDSGPIERNLAPFWTPLTFQQRGNSYDTEIFWGLFRRMKRGNEGIYTSLFPLFDRSTEGFEADASKSEWNLLKGLVGVRKSAKDGKELKLLYFLTFKLGSKSE